MPCVTSRAAYDLAEKLCKEYDMRKDKEKAMNIKREKAEKAQADDPRRKVTDIDYSKHERTVKELKRQEEEEQFQRKKEEASKWCTLDHEHGPWCRQTPGSCSHDHQKEWAIYEKSTEEKVAAANAFREEGNAAYKKHNYGLAAVHYRKALLQFDYTFANGDAEEKAVDDVKLPCLLNLAACKCQQEEWDDVLTQCRLALEVNPRSVKAYYRTGLAHLARDKFDDARDALMSAYEIEPQNPEVIATLKQLKKNMERYKTRQKEVYKEMVTGTQEEEAERVDARSAEAQAAEEEAEAKKRAEAAASQPIEEDVEEVPRCSEVPDSEPVVEVLRESSMPGASSKSSPQPRSDDAGELRQRRAPAAPAAAAEKRPERSSAQEDEDDEDDDNVDILTQSQRKVLVAAVCLGLISVAVGTVAYVYG